MDVDAFFLQTGSIVRTDRSAAVRTEHDARAPRFQRKRKAGGRRAAAYHGNGLIAMLPAIAVRAVMDRDSVALVKARNVRKLVANAARDERHARANFLTGIERRFESVSEMNQIGDGGLAWCDPVGFQFVSAEPEQLERRDAIAGEKAVQRRRTLVARISVVTEQQFASTPPENESSVQASGAAADNDDVEHTRLKCKWAATNAAPRVGARTEGTNTK